MRKLTTLVTAIAAAGALTLPALVVGTAAHAAPGVGTSDTISAEAVSAKAKGLKLKKNKPGSHFGQAGVKIKAVSKKKKGKITFVVAGQGIKDTKKLKKGKASFTLPSTLAAGTYKVKAKVKGGPKATIKSVVYNSNLSLNAPAFTISLSGSCTADPVLAGTVLFKGANPSEGYVDVYLNGNIEGGNSSPDFLTFDIVEGAGAFDFGTCDSLWSDVRALGLGTHNVKLLYTPTPSYSEYVYSDFVAITVVA